MPNNPELASAPEYSSRKIATGVGLAVLMASGCTVEHREPAQVESSASASPTPEASESELLLPQSEILIGESTGLEEWANEVLEVVDCEKDVDVSEYWSGMPHAIAVVSGCEGNARLYNAVDEARQGSEAIMFAMEGEQLWITEEADDEGNYLKVEHFTITEKGTEELSDRPFVVAREDLVTVW